MRISVEALAAQDRLALLAPLLIGFVLGYVGTIAAAGPLAAAIFARAIDGDRRQVRILAAGGAIAEAAWAFAAARGLGYVIAAHPTAGAVLRVAGASLAIFAGLVLVVWPDRGTAALPKARASLFITGFALVALNPSFLVSWIASASLLDQTPALAVALTPLGAPLLALGAAVGVVCWYETLAVIFVRYRERLSKARSVTVRAIGVLLIVAGALSLA